MIIKSRIFGLLTVLVVAFLIFGPEDEPTESEDRGGESKSATERRFQPREPAFQAPGHDYGIADRRGAGTAPSPYYRPESFQQEPRPQGYSGGYGISDSYSGHPEVATRGYRFRPLGEQEQRRTQTSHRDQYGDQYATPYGQPPQYYATPETRPRADSAAPYSTSPAYGAPYQEYSYRPLTKSPSARGRWQGPYESPDWDPSRRFDPYADDPWTAPPHPQWGSMPPSQRMYPNLYSSPGRRLSAR